MKEKSNVDRLVKAGVLDAKGLKKSGYDAINGIEHARRGCQFVGTADSYRLATEGG